MKLADSVSPAAPFFETVLERSPHLIGSWPWRATTEIRCTCASKSANATADRHRSTCPLPCIGLRCLPSILDAT